MYICTPSLKKASERELQTKAKINNTTSGRDGIGRHARLRT